MPTELRLLVFTKAEMVRALYALQTRRGDPLPDGRLDSVEVSEVGDIQVRLKIRALRHKWYELAFEEVDVAAALILHCINSSIPLPVSAKKQLQRASGQVALVVTRGQVPDAVGEAAARATALKPVQ